MACRPIVTVQPQIYGALRASSVISRITLPASKKIILSSTGYSEYELYIV